VESRDTGQKIEDHWTKNLRQIQRVRQNQVQYEQLRVNIAVNQDTRKKSVENSNMFKEREIVIVRRKVVTKTRETKHRRLLTAGSLKTAVIKFPSSS